MKHISKQLLMQGGYENAADITHYVSCLMSTLVSSLSHQTEHEI
jgi:hypothetical protein